MLSSHAAGSNEAVQRRDHRRDRRSSATLKAAWRAVIQRVACVSMPEAMRAKIQSCTLCGSL